MANLTSYLPSSVLSYLVAHKQLIPPVKDDFETVILFADVSGYTAMCEAMSEQGSDGDENLAKTLRSYFELLIKAISKQGGDVFKFAGDAILVVWPPSVEDLGTKVRRAIHAGLQIREHLQDAVLAHGVRLSVKIGIGAGEIGILHLGGIFGRLEYIAIGEPLIQAFKAEHHATKTELVLSPKSWKLVEQYFDGDVQPDGHVFITKTKENSMNVRAISVAVAAATSQKELDVSVAEKMASYIPSAAIPFAGQGNDNWVNETRQITCLFVNLGMQETELVNMVSKEDINRINTILRAVQEAVYRFEGSLNKFLMDDKGSTLIAVFGLPPLAHEDDGARGVLSGLAIRQALNQLGLRCSVGITRGQAYCGVIGNIWRREYTVLGDIVNLSARLMQHCTATGAGILCDTATKEACEQHYSLWHDLTFFAIGGVTVKGKSKVIPIWQPQQKKPDPQLPSVKLQHILNARKTNKKAPPVEESTISADSEFQARQAELLSVCHNCRESKVALIVALPGLGKSVLLMMALAKLGPECLVVFSAGYSYDSASPLRAFKAVFMQLLTRVDPKANPRRWVRAHLPKSKSPLVPVLNDVLNLQFEESEDSSAMKKEDRLKECRGLMLMLFQVLVPELKVGKLIIGIEDAMYLDPQSWLFCSQLCGTVPNMALILVTRPLTKTFMNAFATRVPPDGLDVLLRSPHCTTIQIMPRDDALIARISAQSLKRSKDQDSLKFRPALIELLLDRARGNPLYASELLKFFQTSDLVTFTEGMVNPQPSLCPESNENENNPKLLATPLPNRLASLLYRQLDRLSQPQLSMLKVAAVLGNCFSLRLVRLCQPFEADDNLDEAFDELLAMVIVAKVPQPMRESQDWDQKAEETAEQDKYYCFTDGLMRHVILSRMLVSHQATIIGKVKQHSGLFRDDEPLTTAISGGAKRFKDSICEGVLRKKGHTMKRYNAKYFALFPDKLLYYDMEGKEKDKVKGEIILGNDTIVEIKDVNTIFITTNPNASPRKMELMADLPEEASLWIDFLQKITQRKARQFRSPEDARAVGTGVVPRLQHTKRGGKATLVVQPDSKEAKRFAESAKEAWLLKRGTSIRSWKKRYFVLFRDKLQYYESSTAVSVKGECSIGGETKAEKLNFGKDAGWAFVVSVSPTASRRYILSALSEEERTEWMNLINHFAKLVPSPPKAETTKSAKMAAHSVLEGSLQKQGGTFKNWSTRFFVLFNDRLKYFAEKHGETKGDLPIFKETAVGKSEEKEKEGYIFYFKSTPADAKTYFLMATTKEEMDTWIAAIKLQIQNCNKHAPKDKAK